MKNLLRTTVASAALALLAAGCGTLRPAPTSPAAVPADTQPEAPKAAAERREKAARPAYNLTGYPPAVRDGYIDGCESAKGTSYGRKDAARMASDPQYSMGWNDGFGICKAQRK
jgi:predicted small lipoprotein YifL